MTDAEITRLRGYYLSLTEMKPIFDAHEHPYMEGTPVIVLDEELTHLREDFPDLLPSFTLKTFYSHSDHHTHERYYRVSGVKSQLAVVIARVKAALEQVESTPAVKVRPAAFISDPEIRRVVERDDAELQKAYVTGCWKSVIILSGGIIEAILTDVLVKNAAAARGSCKVPKQSDITRWDLVELIAVAVDLKLVSAGAEKLSHSVREYRNLVHPGNEIRNKLTFDAEEAKIAFEVLNLVWRDASKLP